MNFLIILHLISIAYFFLLRSTTAVIAFGQLIDAYICLDLYRVSATKYKYFLGTTVDSSINDYVKGVMTQTNISMSDACNRATPYAANTFITLVKDGEWHLIGVSLSVNYGQ